MNIKKGQTEIAQYHFIENVSVVLNLLLRGKQPALLSLADYPEEFQGFIELVNELIDSISEIHQFIVPLSHGQLSVDPPKTQNYLASPFKELHSQLRNLIWQVQQVAKGDYGQRVDFMGEFSVAFNSMVQALEENSRLLNEHVALLEREVKLLNEQKILSKYRTLMKHARDIILFYRPNGAIIEANHQAEIAYGYDRMELLSMTVFDLLPQDSKKVSDTELKEAIARGILFESSHRRKDGSTFPVEVSLQGAEIDAETLLIGVIRDITDRKSIQDQLLFLATHDALTRVPNRYHLEETISRYIAHNERQGALLFIDIDNFKIINDTLGHFTGDQLLVKIVTILRNNLRKGDFLARLGGDEFAVLLEEVNIKEAKVIAEKLRKAVGFAKISLDSSGIPLTFSISVGIAPLDSRSTVSDILSHADFLLYQAKELGRNRVISPQNGNNTKDKLSETSKLIRKIHDALEKEQFVLYFQPITNTVSGQITHHEGLVRLEDDEGKVMMPGEFIPVAERVGIMSLIDRRVISLAFTALTNYPDLNLFINISGINLGDEALLKHIEQNIRTTGIDPARLGFEITETAAVRDIPQAEFWIRRLKEIGCLFALDDFGIGFSSFSYLQYLPVDFVKIDGSFVQDLETNERHRILVQTINTVANSFGKKTIAEYVENGEILNILKDYRVNQVQGYYLGRPVPKPSFSL